MSDLRLVPGIGAKKEKELMDLGYGSLEELKNADPDELYFLACAKVIFHICNDRTIPHVYL